MTTTITGSAGGNRPRTGSNAAATAAANSHRARSTSVSSTTTTMTAAHFPSSHDAFGLAASPSSSLTHSPKNSTWFGPRPTSSGSASGGASNSREADGGGGYESTGWSSFAAAVGGTGAGEGGAPSHGSFMMMGGGPNMRMNRPSLLSLQHNFDGGDEQERIDDAAASTAAQAQAQQGSHKSDVDLGMDTDSVGGGADPSILGGSAEEAAKASQIARWRNKLEPSPSIRRVHSAFDTTSGSRIQSSHSRPESPVSPTKPTMSSSSASSFPMRRASSEQSTSILLPPGFRPSLEDLPDAFSPARQESSPKATIASRRAALKAGRMEGSSGSGSTSGEGERSSKGKTPLLGGAGGDGGKARLLPPSLRATLAAEKDLPGQEIRSEALLQKLILSNPTTQPMTPRPSRRVIHNAFGGPGPRTTNNRFQTSFYDDNNSDSDPDLDRDSSDDEIPFDADDLVNETPMTSRTLGGTATGPAGLMWELGGMELDVPSPAARDTGVFDFARPSTRGPSSKASVASLAGGPSDGGGGGSGADTGGEMSDQPRNPLMGWRDSPSAAARPGKRKAAYDEARYEPYGKRHRGSDTNSSAGSAAMLALSPGQRSTGLPAGYTGGGTVPVPMPHSPHQFAADTDMSSSSSVARYSRSRAGSPSTSMSAAQMAMRTAAVSPVASSPLSNGTFRPTLGMGGFGMLLLNKRNQNSVSTGTGLMLGSDRLGEMAVAEGIGGMGVTSATDQDEEMEDKMMFE